MVEVRMDGGEDVVGDIAVDYRPGPVHRIAAGLDLSDEPVLCREKIEIDRDSRDIDLVLAVADRSTGIIFERSVIIGDAGGAIVLGGGDLVEKRPVVERIL